MSREVNARTPGSQKLQRVELRDAVAVELPGSILNGDFASGERLVETELAERYGTSRGPVRDALAELEQSGLVTTTSRKGSFVAALNRSDLAEVYAVRGALEALAIRSAIERATDQHVQQLPARLADLDAAHETADTRTIGEADMQFHRSVVGLAGNQRLLAAWDRLADQTLLLMRALSHVRPDIQGPGGDHQKIVDAFKDRNGAAGEKAILDHLAEAEEALSRHLANLTVR